MTRQDPLYLSDMSHETKFRGDDIGRPAVKLSFASEDSREVAGVLAQFETYNWTSRVSDGHSFLILRDNPFSKKNLDGLETLLYNLRPRYCEAQVSGFNAPPRAIKNDIDSYLVDLKVLDRESGDTENFYLEQSRNYDAADFMVRFETANRTEEKVFEWKSDKKVYPHNIHLYIDENSDDWRDDFEKAETLAGRHGWNVVPPFEVAKDEEPEEDDEES